MPFRTEIKPQLVNPILSYNSPIFSVGSCFAQEIGQKLIDLQLPIIVNPYGTIYNPISIQRNITWSLEPFDLNTDLIVHDQSVFKHFHFHSDVRSLSKEGLIQKLKNLHQQTQSHLQRTKTLFLSLGSAFVYERNNEVVANCHKIPQKEFMKRLLSLDEVKTSIKNLTKLLPHLEHIILTVSPVRHIGDSLELNSVSKSTLRLAIHELEEELSQAYYFPAFEVMMDDLRDYRFYKEDMIHPTDLAVSHIFDHFKSAFFDKKTLMLMKNIDQLNKAVAHKPFNPTSGEHQAFLQKALAKAKELGTQVNITSIIEKLETKLKETNA